MQNKFLNIDYDDNTNIEKTKYHFVENFISPNDIMFYILSLKNEVVMYESNYLINHFIKAQKLENLSEYKWNDILCLTK